MVKYILETAEGDRWEYDNLDDARRSQYIFGGKIINYYITGTSEFIDDVLKLDRLRKEGK